jgi:hypothetical protein
MRDESILKLLLQFFSPDFDPVWIAECGYLTASTLITLLLCPFEKNSLKPEVACYESTIG